MANRTDAVERSKANSGKRCDHEILWPPLYTVKWTREHIPIVFFTERHHSEQSGVGLTGSYETPGIAQAEVRFEWPNSILVRGLFREALSLLTISDLSCSATHVDDVNRLRSSGKGAGFSQLSETF